jgi:2-oxoglutarate dehydrogenase E1 component
VHADGIDYRQQFQKDVVVDIICFRKLGHNEQDTPSLTQPLMYKVIAKHPGTRRLYGEKLVAQGVLAADGPDQMVKDLRAAFDAGRHTADPVLTNFKSKYAVDWAPFPGQEVDRQRPTRRCPWPRSSAWPSASPPCLRTSSCTRWSRR